MPKFTDCFYMIDLLLVLVRNALYSYLDELSKWFYVFFFLRAEINPAVLEKLF